MSEKIKLCPMTPEMYHAFFRQYTNDPELYLDKTAFAEYTYSEERVNAYIQRQTDKKRITLAIMLGEEIVGELKLYDIIPGQSATLGITMKNDRFKNKGYGTRAEQLAAEYVFRQLRIPTLRADTVLTNTRSQHVLEKVGFRFLYEDEQKKYYILTAPT